MILVANILFGLGSILSMAFGIMMFVVILRAIISWVNPDPFNPIVRFLVLASDPLLRPIRRYVPTFGGVDLSPLLLIMVLYLLKFIVAQSLIDYAMLMKSGASF